MSIANRWTGLSSRWNALFQDREVFIRTGGDVRFLRIGARSQRRAATAAMTAAGLWASATAGLIGWQAWDAWRDGDVAARAVAVQQAEARVAAQSGQVADVAQQLSERQNYIETLFDTHFGAEEGADGTATAGDETANPASDDDTVARLQRIGDRQERLVAALTSAVGARAERAEAALRSVGIRPDATGGRGGPFEPVARAAVPAPTDPALRRLSAAIDRMEMLEQLVVAIPSRLPADTMSLSSGFGQRRDPFNGSRAMHSGLDFTGPHGSPIRAAAAGRVSFVGAQSGYGNTVEIDHGHGIMTRYAHLSGFAARVGQTVAPGQQIARMGSTGRSTGTHLHFEVRVNGAAVNPRRFLEANADVLEIQADAGERVRASRRAD